MSQKNKIELSEQVRSWLNSGGNFPEFLELQGLQGNSRKYKILQRESDGSIPSVSERIGFKGFVLKVQNADTLEVLAAKICLSEDYNEDKLKSELVNSNKLSHIDAVSTHIDVGFVSGLANQPSDAPEKWLCFISEWIEGITIEDAILDNDNLRPSLVISILQDFVTSVLLIQQKSLKHDDLHLRNLMLQKVPEDELLINPTSPEWRFKIVDLGSLKPLEQKTKKSRDDLASIIDCIVSYHNAIHSRRELAARYANFLFGLEKLAEKLCDPDQSRFFPQLSDYTKSITELSVSLTNDRLGDGEINKFADPFEALSAEHLSSDQLLCDLFEDTLPWIKRLNSKTPIALTGPRGCGKSMVFRYMAIKTHCNNETNALAALDKFNFFGIYVSCSHYIEHDVLWMREKKGIAKDNSKELVTFLNLILCRELLLTLSKIFGLPKAAQKLGFNEHNINEIVVYISEKIGRSPPNVSGENILEALTQHVDSYRCEVGRCMFENITINKHLPHTFIRDLVHKIKSIFSGFKNIPIAFLLDDFTSHRIGSEVQEILNPLIWQRSSEYIFKISAEPLGFNPVHPYGSTIDNLREFEHIDTSQDLISGSAEDRKKRIKFVTGLIDKRLKTANYLGDVDTLIGPSKYKDDVALANAIHESDQASGKQTHYHGINVLANCWSGDVITLLFMAERMFSLANVVDNTTQRIPAEKQHKAIQEVSKALVHRLTHYHPYGDHLRKFMDFWGGIARYHIKENGKNKNDEVRRFYRIEIPFSEHGDIYESLEALNNGREASEILRQLVRRSVVVELTESRPKEKQYSFAARFQIRSSFLPNYGTSLVRLNHLPIKSVEELRQFLLCEDGIESKLKKIGSVSKNQECQNKQIELL